MKAKIYINYKDGILDPEGLTVSKALKSIGIKGLQDISIGKYIEINFNDISKEEASLKTKESCEKLLVNPNTQTYKFEILE